MRKRGRKVTAEKMARAARATTVPELTEDGSRGWDGPGAVKEPGSPRKVLRFDPEQARCRHCADGRPTNITGNHIADDGLPTLPCSARGGFA